MGELPPEECQAEVWVLHDAVAPEAEAMLRFTPTPLHATPWRCDCGEWVEPQFSACWRCMAQKSE
jgi:hypothetical protein